MLKIPFDISGIRTIKFDLDIKCAEEAKSELREQIKSIKKGRFLPDNPITNAMNQNAIREALTTSGQEKVDITEILSQAIFKLRPMLDEIIERMDRLENNINPGRKSAQEEWTLPDIQKWESEISSDELELDFLEKEIENKGPSTGPMSLEEKAMLVRKNELMNKIEMLKKRRNMALHGR